MPSPHGNGATGFKPIRGYAQLWRDGLPRGKVQPNRAWGAPLLGVEGRVCAAADPAFGKARRWERDADRRERSRLLGLGQGVELGPELGLGQEVELGPGLAILIPPRIPTLYSSS